MDDRPIFIDTNVLVYANILAYPLHTVAAEFLQSLIDAEVELWLSRQVLREFIAAVTRPQTYGSPQPITVVIERVRTFQTQFRVAEDNVQVTDQLLNLLQQFPTAGRQVHDANIVATMLTAGVERLLTHNVGDFDRFSGLITVIPLVTAA
ncbi:type II toxin-antitoxin system VapC family toxin [Leptolyngbya sp. NK1-12]|uniref:Ribonuclease VapC n=1 Tax=Leptolyngbya sp. NK1-12 TaxID=2547451 RepID=A0AA96WP17_9CYAN|nr:type II toxin-antitoxin system VapC family toxin [Leptolyngbya sp. NK1-12]WNZ26286.1 type II toxin-antitoxin system VapC family toxin [Leptolyngbya sp. NK1-12]